MLKWQHFMGEKMEVLGSQKPLVVTVVGLPGSGKSFFARQFAETLNCPLVSTDQIRWTLFANHTHSEDEDLMVQQVADILTAELFKTKKVFVLDGGCNTRIEREAVSKRATRAGFRVLTVVTQVDEPTAKHRATKRSEKNPGDLYKQPMSDDDFAQILKKFQMPVNSSNMVVISGKHTYSTQARTVLKKILSMQKSPTASSSAAAKPPAANRPASVLLGRGGSFMQ